MKFSCITYHEFVLLEKEGRRKPINGTGGEASSAPPRLALEGAAVNEEVVSQPWFKCTYRADVN